MALLALGEAVASPEDGSHLPDCAECQAELAQLAGVVTAARSAEGSDWLEEPPSGLWARVAAEAGVDPDGGPGRVAGADGERPPGALRPADNRPPGNGPADNRPPGRLSARQRRPVAWWRPVVVVAVALIVGVAGTLGLQRLSGNPPRPAVIGTSTLRPLTQFPQYRDARGTMVMERDGSAQELRVSLRVPRRRQGFYEVWLLARDGVRMISLGDLSPAQTGVFTLPPGVDLGDYTRVDVSLQAFNGNPAHSAISVVRGTLP
jgi:hypothetical protein